MGSGSERSEGLFLCECGEVGAAGGRGACEPRCRAAVDAAGFRWLAFGR
ncbi:hypothetical protein HNR22_001817 [Micromonospora jinlongensis]|uniref:Uncharacterized protein n=1 Tax=Micromonospora jinlongensis TaxID=1287877 RepID=A0A7Y9X152_9ACTN|nr:hypothetical protein [Micromonospora jinlongensis]